MSAVGKQLVFKFLQYVVRFRRIFRQGLVKKLVERARVNIGEDGALFYVFEIIRKEINYSMAQVAKLIGVHLSSTAGRL
jgi:hypothetical protein